MAPVSYTHLDVYKRQEGLRDHGRPCCGGTGARGGQELIRSVSGPTRRDGPHGGLGDPAAEVGQRGDVLDQRDDGGCLLYTSRCV